MKPIPLWARLALVILIAIALSEAIPEIVNAILILILIGLLLGHWQQFSFVARALGSLESR